MLCFYNSTHPEYSGKNHFQISLCVGSINYCRLIFSVGLMLWIKNGISYTVKLFDFKVFSHTKFSLLAVIPLFYRSQITDDP